MLRRWAIILHQPCQHRLSQATTYSMNGGHHWKCMAREHPFEGNYVASTNRSWLPNGLKTSSLKYPWRMRGLSLSPRAKDDCLEFLTSNTDCCYQRLSLATVVMLRTYNFERAPVKMATGCINSQIQHSWRILNVNITTTAHILIPVFVVFWANNH